MPCMVQDHQPHVATSHVPRQTSAGEAATAGRMHDGSLKAVLEGLEELWDQHQYAEEFGVDCFLKKLASTQA